MFSSSASKDGKTPREFPSISAYVFIVNLTITDSVNGEECKAKTNYAFVA